MGRASRKRLLPIGTAHGSPGENWELTDDAWHRCELAWEVSIDADTRHDIRDIVRAAIDREPFGRTAPFADDAIEWLKRVEKAARQFAAIKTHAPGGGATAYAEGCINSTLNTIPDTAFLDLMRNRGEPRVKLTDEPLFKLRLRFAIRIATEVQHAARQAKAELQEESYPAFHEKSAWKTMIQKLWQMANERGLPAGINKSGIRKTKEVGIVDKTSSPFVAFVSELQHSLPEGLNRHNHSLPALATAMTDAMEPLRREIKTPPAES